MQDETQRRFQPYTEGPLMPYLEPLRQKKLWFHSDIAMSTDYKVLGYLAYCTNWGLTECRSTSNEISKGIKVEVSSVKNAIRRLKEKGIITVLQISANERSIFLNVEKAFEFKLHP